MSTSNPDNTPANPDGRPPVEHRLLGLDRRTVVGSLIVVSVFLLWAVIVPSINNAVGFDDPVEAGDALIIGKTTTFAPPVGWGVQSGVRMSEPTRAPTAAPRVVLVGDGIQVGTQSGPFKGDAAALVKQVVRNSTALQADSAFTVEGAPRTVSVDGRRGVGQQFKTITGEGAVFGFVENGEGIVIVASGTGAALSRQATKLGQMVASIDFETKGLDD